MFLVILYNGGGSTLIVWTFSQQDSQEQWCHEGKGSPSRLVCFWGFFWEGWGSNCSFGAWFLKGSNTHLGDLILRSIMFDLGVCEHVPYTSLCCFICFLSKWTTSKVIFRAHDIWRHTVASLWSLCWKYHSNVKYESLFGTEVHLEW